jgi:NAD(P)-dependent dehydrogenase (short-subunit alcohol dehydrogenase family)
VSLESGQLKGKRVVVLGGSRGVGLEIAELANAQGARVLAVARTERDLDSLAKRGMDTLALDATTDAAPKAVFQAEKPDLLVICGGATPRTLPIPELSWTDFSVNWEVDVKMSFLFCQEALLAPLALGSVVVIIASGAGLGGSSLGGGYSGAKRTQMFLAKTCQTESDRRELGIRFMALVPNRIMPETELGKAALDGYVRYLGIPAEQFLANMGGRQSPADVARAVLNAATKPPAETGSIFTISPDGVAAVS